MTVSVSSRQVLKERLSLFENLRALERYRSGADQPAHALFATNKRFWPCQMRHVWHQPVQTDAAKGDGTLNTSYGIAGYSLYSSYDEHLLSGHAFRLQWLDASWSGCHCLSGLCWLCLRLYWHACCAEPRPVWRGSANARSSQRTGEIARHINGATHTNAPGKRCHASLKARERVPVSGPCRALEKWIANSSGASWSHTSGCSPLLQRVSTLQGFPRSAMIC